MLYVPMDIYVPMYRHVHMCTYMELARRADTHRRADTTARTHLRGHSQRTAISAAGRERRSLADPRRPRLQCSHVFLILPLFIFVIFVLLLVIGGVELVDEILEVLLDESGQVLVIHRGRRSRNNANRVPIDAILHV